MYCSACHRVLVNPRTLPCLHSFCLQCVESSSPQSTGRQTVYCCKCQRQYTGRINAGLSLARRNTFLETLLHLKLAEEHPMKDELQCDTCKPVPTLAQNCCMDCQLKLCESCTRPHRMWTGGVQHQITALDEKTRLELLKLQRNVCSQHIGHQRKLFCQVCRVNICMKCFMAKHQQHECDDIREVAGGFLEQIRREMVTLREEFQHKASRMDKEYRTLLDEIQATKRQIREKRSSLKREIDKHVEDAILKIREKGETAKTLLDIEIDDLIDELNNMTDSETTGRELCEIASTRVDSFVEYCSQLCDKGRPCDITDAVDDLHEQFAELRASELYNRVGANRAPCLELVNAESPDIARVVDNPYANSLRLVGDIAHVPGES